MGCYNVNIDAHNGTKWTTNDGTKRATHSSAYPLTDTAPLTGVCMIYSGRWACNDENERPSFASRKILRRK
jgi:hypothetical protein